MTGGEEFSRRYAIAFERYLDKPGEDRLSAAYETGRSAVREGLSVLDLAAAHHDALLATASARGDSAAEGVIRAGGEFLLEAVSAFEMVQRVLQEARETASVERRQAAVLRQLSSFLADASIALDASSSLTEMLQLVAEHAREMICAASCVARVALDAGAEDEASARVDARAPRDDDGTGEPADLTALYAAVRPPAGSMRMSAVDLARHPVVQALEPRARSAELTSWMAAPLTALDGREIGLIQLFGKEGGEFTDLDEAVLVQLAQMAAAAVERAQLYQR